MGARVLAFLAAVAMIAGAVAIRARLDNGGGSSAKGGQLHLVCATEVAAACDAIDAAHLGVDVTVEPASVTADRLHSADPATAPVDGWLAPGPWGDIVDAARPTSAEPLFAAAGAPVARSPFVLAVWKNKRAVLACADPVGLGCVGDATITRGFRLGAAADDQAEGLLADAALAAGHIKNPNFATNDLNETDLSDWLTSVDTKADAVRRNPGGRSFTELLTFGAAAADGFLATEAEIAPQLDRAAKRNEIDFIRLSPVATADVTFSPRVGDRGKRLSRIVISDRVRAALRTNGWRVDDTGSPRLPDDDGLPSAGVLDALRDVTK